MKSIIKNILILALFLFVLGCGRNNTTVRFDNENVTYNGRVEFNDSTAIFYWPGTLAKIHFTGSDLSVILKDEKFQNYYNIILDGKVIAILRPDSNKSTYNLVKNIKEGEHTLEIFKRTEWTKGKTLFYGFKLANGTELLPKQKKKRTIEFFGNSITTGYANESHDGNNPDSVFTNNYLSYAAITTRHFNTNYYCTSRSGIGITISWFPLIMDELYYRLNPSDPNSNWDFSKVQPDIVIINLFQNDAWLTERPKFDEFITRFGKTRPTPEFIINSYKNFIQKIRSVYSKTHIICTLGSMDATEKGSPWPGYIKNAVSMMNDSNIYTFFFPYHSIPGHPLVKDHQEMANQLIAFIEETFPKWKR